LKIEGQENKQEYGGDRRTGQQTGDC